MKHRVYGRHLGRSTNERTALFKNLVRSLILSEKIHTTEAKAKAIKGLVDQIINQAKSKNTQRLVSQFLVNKKVEEKLFKTLAPRLQNRTSGYTSIVKLGRRLGDGAPIVQMQLLLEQEVKAVSVKKAKAKQVDVERTKRTRRK